MSNSNKLYNPKNLYNIQRANVNFRDSTRGVHSLGATPSTVNTVDLVNTVAGGNTSDFGDLSVARARITNGSTSNTISLLKI